MIVRNSGMRGDIIHSLAYLPYYGMDNTLIITYEESHKWVGSPGTPIATYPIQEEEVKEFKRFLTKQCYITDVLSKGMWDLDLDMMRRYLVTDNPNPALNVSIIEAYGKVYKVPDQRWRPSKNGWIDPSLYPKMNHGKKIIINKTLRYHSGGTDYTILKDYAQTCGFVGSVEEHDRFEKAYFKLDYIQATNITDIARAIYSSNIFVGAQSLPNCLAEAAAHPRILEACGTSVHPYTNNASMVLNLNNVLPFIEKPLS
jgi:hypothetical protein